MQLPSSHGWLIETSGREHASAGEKWPDARKINAQKVKRVCHGFYNARQALLLPSGIARFVEVYLRCTLCFCQVPLTHGEGEFHVKGDGDARRKFWIESFTQTNLGAVLAWLKLIIREMKIRVYSKRERQKLPRDHDFPAIFYVCRWPFSMRRGLFSRSSTT